VNTHLSATTRHKRMQMAIIGHFLGMILLVMAACMMIPLLVEAQYNNPENVRAFFLCMLGTLFIGGLLYFSNRQPMPYVSVRQCFLLLTLCWLSASVAAAMPLYLTDARLDLADAVFEGVAGITTTSATVMEDLQGHSRGILLWRSMLQLIGGAGAIILGLIFLPMMRIGGMQHFRTQSADISAKTLPRMQSQISGILTIYVVLCFAGFLAYHAAGMNWFDALNHAMTSLSTGGFSTYDANLGAFAEPAIHWIAIGLMILGACPFVLYLRTVAWNSPQLFTNTQVRTFVVLIIVFTSLLALWLYLTGTIAPMHALRLSAVTVTSTLTTTGYVIGDSMYWGHFAAMLILFLSYLGGVCRLDGRRA
jgi:trk system potassium uptake protein TrkH